MSVWVEDVGRRSWEKVKNRPARKRTKFMTNSSEIAGELKRRCRGEHVHEHLTGKKATEAAERVNGSDPR